MIRSFIFRNIFFLFTEKFKLLMIFIKTLLTKKINLNPIFQYNKQFSIFLSDTHQDILAFHKPWSLLSLLGNFLQGKFWSKFESHFHKWRYKSKDPIHSSPLQWAAVITKFLEIKVTPHPINFPIQSKPLNKKSSIFWNLFGISPARAIAVHVTRNHRQLWLVEGYCIRNWLWSVRNMKLNCHRIVSRKVTCRFLPRHKLAVNKTYDPRTLWTIP